MKDDKSKVENASTEFSNLQEVIMQKYAKLKSEGLVKEPVDKNKMIDKIAQYMLNHSNIPKKYLKQELSDLSLTAEQKKMCFQIIQAYKDNLENNLEKGQGAYLWASGHGGNKWGTGTGKTSLAVILIKSIIKDLAEYVYDSLERRQREALEIKNWTTPVRKHDIFQSKHIPYFITGATYFQKLNEADQSDKENLKARARNALILIWDDYGTEKVEWFHDEIFGLINSRIDNNKPIIFTSNWNLNVFAEMDFRKNNDEMKERGGRIASRIAGMVNGLVFRMEGKDWRMKGLKNINW